MSIGRTKSVPKPARQQRRKTPKEKTLSSLAEAQIRAKSFSKSCSVQKDTKNKKVYLVLKNKKKVLLSDNAQDIKSHLIIKQVEKRLIYLDIITKTLYEESIYELLSDVGDHENYRFYLNFKNILEKLSGDNLTINWGELKSYKPKREEFRLGIQSLIILDHDKTLAQEVRLLMQAKELSQAIFNRSLFYLDDLKIVKAVIISGRKISLTESPRFKNLILELFNLNAFDAKSGKPLASLKSLDGHSKSYRFLRYEIKKLREHHEDSFINNIINYDYSKKVIFLNPLVNFSQE